MGIGADSGSDDKEAGAAIPVKIEIFHASNRGAPWLGGQVGAGRRDGGKRQIQIVCQSVGRPQGNYAQSCGAADHALQHVMYRAVAATGKDGVATLGDGVARLFWRIRLAASGLQRRLYSSLAQDVQCRFHVRQTAQVALPRQRVVKKHGLAHGLSSMDCRNIDQWKTNRRSDRKI